ncbi:MAG: methyltransferase [Methanomicrobiales archaeon]|nr:methyltransferase [Methanomicrobiales archaeon]
MDEKRSFFTSEPPEDPGRFYEKIDTAIRGQREFSLISAAVELGIFDVCATPVTAEDLASRISADREMCRLLCEALVAEGLLTFDSGKYSDTAMTSTYLARSSPYSQVHYIGQLGTMAKELWAPLARIVLNGPVQYGKEDFFRGYSLPAMAENAVSGRIQAVTRAIIGLPGFSRIRRVLDLGGGHGLYAIALGIQRPDIQAWVFDLPHVVTLAERYLEQYRVENVHLIPGDFFTDSFGEGYDLVISSSNPSGKSIQLLPKISGAMNEGGFFVNIQSAGGPPGDPLQSLEWKLWTFTGVNKLQGECTKEQVFMTPAYREALLENGLLVIDERDIRDHYHKDTYVRMVIARKGIETNG